MIDLYHDSNPPIVMVNGSPIILGVATSISKEDAAAAAPAIPESLDDKSLGAPMEQQSTDPFDENTRKQPLRHNENAHETADGDAMESLPEGGRADLDKSPNPSYPH